MKSLTTILSLGWALLALTSSAATPLLPTDLRCEYRRDPLGIDTTHPRLSWTYPSAPGTRGLLQSAYQILVASTPDKLAQDQGDLWDTGKVESDRQIQIVYGGNPLPSRGYCHWKARVWDKDGERSPWSAPATWSMGLLKPGDWLGQWIAATDQLTAPATSGLAGYHALEAKTADEIKWVQVDLGKERVIEAVRLCPPAPAGFEHVKGFGFPVRFRIEASNDPGFDITETIVDQSQADFPNPGNEPCHFSANGVRGRYVRVTATRLWNRQSGAEPFCFALAELEILSQGANVALDASVQAKDSVEASGWSLGRLTDGERLVLEQTPVSNGPGNAAVLVRKEFQLDREISRATAFLCGLGYSELELNGRKVGDDVLDPGFTDFNRRVLYRTYDVTGALRRGPNVVGAVLGGGWFNLATADLFAFERAPWSASPRMICQIHLEFADGTSQTVVSDQSWKWSTGAITFNCVRGGETIDARADKPGWSLPGYDDSAWRGAVTVAAPGGKLVSQQHPAIRATASIRPVSLTQPKPGVYVFDLGLNIAGWASLNTRGPRGSRVQLEHNERLNPDGTLDTRNLTSHTRGRFQTAEFVLKGEGLETFEPRFTYHGFRYVQVTGLAEPPTLDTLTGHWVTTDPEPAGEFTCSDPRINKLQEVIVRTFLNNLHGIPTDCPQREKMGWMNDGSVCMEMGFLNRDTPLFYRKWFNDMVDAQDANGHVPDFVPTSGWGRSKPDGAPGDMADPWWGGAVVLAPWKLYQYYDDTRVLEEGYPAMKAYVDYLSSTAKDKVISWGLGDWLDESAGGGGRRVPVAQTSTAAYFLYSRILSQVAALLDRTDDSLHYANQAEAIRAAFNERFLDPGSGLYAKDSQTAQALPLALGLAPEDRRSLILEQLVQSISGSRKNHVSAGIVGVLYLFHALMENGRDDLAWAMLSQEDYPGWLHMLNEGATSIWEAWNGEASLNHPTFGCVGFWFYQGLGGIRPATVAPGFKRMLIKPALVGDLEWVKCAYASVHGKIESHWRRDKDTLLLEITIPANTRATVYIPTTQPNAVTESGVPADQAPGVKLLRSEAVAVVYEIGSGTYCFKAPASSL